MIDLWLDSGTAVIVLVPFTLLYLVGACIVWVTHLSPARPFFASCIGIVGPFDYLFKGRGTHEQVYNEELNACPAVKERVASAERITRARRIASETRLSTIHPSTSSR